MKNEDIAEEFAQGNEAKTGNMFSERTGNEGETELTVFSYGYHFPIAVDKGNYYLFNTCDYSNSTARYKHYVERAIRGIVIKIKDCKELLAGEQIKCNDTQIAELYKKLSSARKDTIKEAYKQDIEELKEQNDLIKVHILPKIVMEEI